MLGWETIRDEFDFLRKERAQRRARVRRILEILRAWPGYPKPRLRDSKSLKWAIRSGSALSLTLAFLWWESIPGWISIGLFFLTVYGEVWQRCAASLSRREIDRQAQDRLNEIKVIDYLALSPASLFPQIELPESYCLSGYRVSSYHHGFVAWSPELNDWLIELGGGEIGLSQDAAAFKLPATLRQDVQHYVALARSGIVLSNDAKIRLSTNLVRDAAGQFPSQLVLQRTDYLSTLCTNDLSFKHVINCRTRKSLYGGVRFFLTGDASGPLTYRGLENSECSNQIGASTIAFTADGYLVLVDQTAGNLQSSGLVAPSGSGSLDWDDLAPSDEHFVDWIRKASQRELREELGIQPDKELGRRHEEAVSTISIETILIGYCEYLFRGGKPEFFFLAMIDCTHAELDSRHAYPETEARFSQHFVTSEVYRLRKDKDAATEVARVLQELKSSEGLWLSCPLEAQIDMLERVCARHPDKVRTLFAGAGYRQGSVSSTSA